MFERGRQKRTKTMRLNKGADERAQTAMEAMRTGKEIALAGYGIMSRTSSE
jgi:hypothetical protein